MLVQSARGCFHSCSPGFVVVNQVVLQEPEAIWCVALWGVLLWWTIVVDWSQGSGIAPAEYPKWFVVITGCLMCKLCLVGAARLWSATFNLSKGFPERPTGAAPAVWGQRWWAKWYHSQHLLSWVLREFRCQGTHTEWKGHFESNILALLLYSQNSGNQQCYIMTTKWEGEPSVAEARQGHVCSLLRERHKRQFDTDLYTSWPGSKISGEDLLERTLPNGGS